MLEKSRELSWIWYYVQRNPFPFSRSFTTNTWLKVASEYAIVTT